MEMAPSPSRVDVARTSGLETVGERSIEVSPESIPWVNEKDTIPTRLVNSPEGVFQFGNIIGASNALRKLADRLTQQRTIALIVACMMQ